MHGSGVAVGEVTRLLIINRCTMDERELNKLCNHMTEEEKLEFKARIMGFSVSESKEILRINIESEKYLYLEIDKWPNFQVKWDFNPENFHYALDRYSKDSFESTFSTGILLAEADLSEIDKNLAKQSQRSIEETWTLGSPDLVAKAILYWVEGNSMSPPMIEFNTDDKFLKITGGNHRVAVCRAKQEKKIPFITLPECEDDISKTIKSVNWRNKFNF